MTVNNTHADWWKQAVVYQVYPRSFRDANGDGLGDIRGITKQMGYLHDLGIDAIWLSPFYPSPLADGGYDVADYRNVDPRLGTIDDFDEMAEAAHEHGLKVVVDIVPNHTSNEHPWFQAALAAGRGSAERDRYIFREGRGEHGEIPPNDWLSLFGGPAWEQVEDGQWYLHIFTPEQPDLNWDLEEVREDFKKTLRFWCDHGADGFRVDVAHALTKDLEFKPLVELGRMPIDDQTNPYGENPLWDRPEVHEIYRGWREVFNEYDPPRFAVAEAWVQPDHQYLYASEDELGQIFNFEFAKAIWSADDFRRAIQDGLDAAERSGSTTTWVLSNHDVPRHPTRFGLPQVKAPRYHQLETDWLLRDGTTYHEDRVLGTKRARAALLMEMALPGSVYVYQGEELGLFEVANIPWDRLQDPQAFNTNHRYAIKGRDGCRVPLPWKSSDAPEPASWDEAFGEGATGTFGFSDDAPEGGHASPHLPQPLWYADLAADVEEDDPDSMLALYRAALRLRAELLTATGDTEAAWADPVQLGSEPDQVIAYVRTAVNDGTLTCITNFGSVPLEIPAGDVVLSSAPLTGSVLGQDESVWVLS